MVVRKETEGTPVEEVEALSAVYHAVPQHWCVS